MASEAREDKRNLISTLEEADFASIKDSIDELTYDTKEVRDNLHIMLADILAEVQRE